MHSLVLRVVNKTNGYRENYDCTPQTRFCLLLRHNVKTLPWSIHELIGFEDRVDDYTGILVTDRPDEKIPFIRNRLQFPQFVSEVTARSLLTTQTSDPSRFEDPVTVARIQEASTVKLWWKNMAGMERGVGLELTSCVSHLSEMNKGRKKSEITSWASSVDLLSGLRSIGGNLDHCKSDERSGRISLPIIMSWSGEAAKDSVHYLLGCNSVCQNRAIFSPVNAQSDWKWLRQVFIPWTTPPLGSATRHEYIATPGGHGNRPPNHPIIYWNWLRCDMTWISDSLQSINRAELNI